MKDPYVDITQGLRGWFVVLLCWNDDENFYEPWTSSAISHRTPQEAAEEALLWAYLEGVRCAFYGPVQEPPDE